MKNLKITLLSLIIIGLLSFIAYITYTFVEPKAYDYMVKHVMTERLPFDNGKNIYGHDNVVLVVIDAETMEKYRWPWKRDLNCKIFDYFNEYAKPKVFFHDAIVTSLDTDNPESDKKFFRTLSRFDNLVEGFMYGVKPFEDQENGIKYSKMFTDKYSVKNAEIKVEFPQVFYSLLISPQEFIDSVKHIGSIYMIPGFLNGNPVDDTYRTGLYFVNYGNMLMPSLAMEGFLLSHDNPKVVIDKKFISFPELNYKIKHTMSPYIYTSVVPIKYYKRLSNSVYSHKHYSALDIMDSYDSIKSGKKPKIDPGIFKNKYVLLGVNDPLKDGLNDNKSSPIAVNHPALDIQATSLDNIVNRDFIIVLPAWVNLLIALAGMLLVYFTIRTHRLVKAIICSVCIILLIPLISAVCFYYSVAINMITPVVMCVVTMIFAYIHRYIIEAKTKEKVENAMGKYMSEDVMKRVIQNIDNLGLGGKKAVVTVLFSDIRGFTAMSEKMSAHDVSQLLNEYFSEMEPIVTKYNGIINKFIGDAVMAVFGEPINDENHPLNAVRCGYEMLQKVQELDKKWQAENKPVIEIGIGINTGEVFVGNIGSEKRMEYTVIGDTVNLASRLESYNKTYNTHMLISSTTYESAKDFVTANRITDVEIRGKAEKMNIYEITDCIL